MSKVTGFFTELMRRYLPDPFVFAIGLTLLTLLLATVVQHQNFIAVTASWGKGFWSLLAFTTQMAVILVMGYVLATAPFTDRLLDAIVSGVRTPRTAIVVATLVGAMGSYLNWGFGLVIGGVVAKKLATNVKGVHYPLIIASAYSGFTLYGLGLSASIPVLISTKGHPLEAQMGVVSLSQTIFSVPMLMTSAVLLATLPLLNAWLHPKPNEHIIEAPRDRKEKADVEEVDLGTLFGPGLVNTISKAFVGVATPATLPFWGLVSSFVINFFAPSGGGHWVIQGPFMVDAAKTLGASIPHTAMSVMLGNAWNDMIQPFWILPALALSKLKVKDVMGSRS